MLRSRSTPSRASLFRLGLLIGGVLALAACGDDADAPEPAPPLWPTGDLVAVAAASEGRVLVATRDGTILRSTDAGGLWSRGQEPPTEALSDLAMVDAERGWAVGPGTILHTEDGGRRWTRQRLPGQTRDWPLVGVAAIDADRAVAIARDGRWLVTVDAGGLWRLPEIEVDPEVPAPARLAAVDCQATPRPRCWAVGDRVVAIDPVEGTWAARGIADPAGLAPFLFRAGGVDLGTEDAERLREAATRLARRAVRWTVEATVTAEERRRFAEDEDPSALFDRIEARVGEVVGLLESVGVERDRITLLGAPPWGYEEHLDDDPGFLDRYWAGRLAPVPSASVRAQERVELRAVLVREDGLVAADDRGRIFEGEGEVAPLAGGVRAFPHALLDLARAGNRVLAVGRQGGLFVGRPERGRLAFTAAPIGPGGGVFET
ncbi:MAG: YCF48-related protein, partial [Myxococcota bacterium]